MLVFKTLRTHFIGATVAAGGFYVFEHNMGETHDPGRPDPRVIRTIKLEEDGPDIRPEARTTHLIDPPELPEAFQHFRIL